MTKAYHPCQQGYQWRICKDTHILGNSLAKNPFRFKRRDTVDWQVFLGSPHRWRWRRSLSLLFFCRSFLAKLSTIVQRTEYRSLSTIYKNYWIFCSGFKLGGPNYDESVPSLSTGSSVAWTEVCIVSISCSVRLTFCDSIGSCETPTSNSFAFCVLRFDVLVGESGT